MRLKTTGAWDRAHEPRLDRLPPPPWLPQLDPTRVIPDQTPKKQACIPVWPGSRKQVYRG